MTFDLLVTLVAHVRMATAERGEAHIIMSDYSYIKLNIKLNHFISNAFTVRTPAHVRTLYTI